MINILIQAYRAKFYDLSLSKFWTIMKPKRVSLMSILLVLILVLLILSLCFKSPLLMFLSAILTFLLVTVANRRLVKQSQVHLRNKAMHLKKVKVFLETVYPESNLYSAEKIDMLINRLSEYVSKCQPYKSFLDKLGAFVKSIILPVITYIAGIYSSDLGTLGFSEVVGPAITIIIMLAILYTVGSFIFSLCRQIICQNYNAALALCEDLQDIKLIYFTESCTPKQK